MNLLWTLNNSSEFIKNEIRILEKVHGGEIERYLVFFLGYLLALRLSDDGEKQKLL